MICKQYKFINIHIKKCGGRSLAAVFPELEDMHETFIDCYRLLRENLANYFLWTIVRNPWDRMVSLYAYHRDETGMCEDTFEIFIKNMYFKTFLRYYSEPEKYPFDSKPQINYLKDVEGNLAVDYVAFLPNIKEDFEKIRQFCGMPAEIIYPHFWKTKRTDHREYYDETTKNMVEELFKEEIELFKFDFDDITKFEYPLELKKQEQWRKRIHLNDKAI
jgi:chondroitin 4-sulfotransferase 11